MQTQSSHHLPRWFELCCVGGTAGLAGLLTTLLSFVFLGVVAESTTTNYVWFYYAAVFAAVIVGPLLWWLMYDRFPGASLGRGMLVGAAASLICHPLVWGFALLLWHLFGREGFIWLEGGEITAANSIGFVARLSFESWLLVGWITTIIGGGVGGLLGRLFAEKNVVMATITD